MALTINTNISSIRTNRALETAQKELSGSIQRISSGIRLNSAKDDPAGLVTSDRLSVQIRSVSMAIRNASDGISLSQTAEGGLQEVTTMLQRAQELTVQASNPSSSTSSRASLQAELTQLTDEITRISEQTEFNGQKLLSGKMINVNFQVGGRPEEVIGLSIPEVSATNLGNFYAASDNVGERSMGMANKGIVQGEAPGNLVTEQTLTIRGFNTKAVSPTIDVAFEESTASIVRKINDAESLTGVMATGKTTLTLQDVYDQADAGTQNISFRLFGTNKKDADLDNGANIAASIKNVSEPGFRSLVSAINAQRNITGITATYKEGGAIVLSHETGENISLEAFSNASDDETPDSPLDSVRVVGASGTPEQTLIEGTADDSVTVGGVIQFNSPKPFSVSSSINAEDGSLFDNATEGEPQASQFSSLFKVDVTTIEGAGKAIDVVSNALEQITSLRGELGAIQNRFESAISNLQSIQENTQNARSRIVDTDFSDEVSRFTRAQILQQAGIAILAQANAAPFAVLELLRS